MLSNKLEMCLIHFKSKFLIGPKTWDNAKNKKSWQLA